MQGQAKKPKRSSPCFEDVAFLLPTFLAQEDTARAHVVNRYVRSVFRCIPFRCRLLESSEMLESLDRRLGVLTNLDLQVSGPIDLIALPRFTPKLKILSLGPFTEKWFKTFDFPQLQKLCISSWHYTLDTTLFPLGLKCLELVDVRLSQNALDLTGFLNLEEVLIWLCSGALRAPATLLSLPPTVTRLRVTNELFFAPDALLPAVASLGLFGSEANCFEKAFVPHNWPALRHFQAFEPSFCMMFREPFPLESFTVHNPALSNPEKFTDTIATVAGQTLRTLGSPQFLCSHKDAFPQLRTLRTNLWQNPALNSLLELRSALRELKIVSSWTEPEQLRVVPSFALLERLNLQSFSPIGKEPQEIPLDVSALAVGAPNLRHLTMVSILCLWNRFEFPRLDTLVLRPLTSFAWWPELPSEGTCSLRHFELDGSMMIPSSTDALCTSIASMNRLAWLKLTRFSLDSAPVRDKALETNPNCVILTSVF